uniref:Putative non-structural protein n=1 Tax=Picornavirales N_OV_064 TaxID=2016028 RepID=A0A218NJU6_9VIRU|nr:putative non-structural protein [Picornavirales N_OV_064]
MQTQPKQNDSILSTPKSTPTFEPTHPQEKKVSQILPPPLATEDNTPFSDDELAALLTQLDESRILNRSLKFEPTSAAAFKALWKHDLGTSSDVHQRILDIAKRANLCLGARALGFISTLLITTAIMYESGDNFRLKIIAVINFIQRSMFLASNEYLVALISQFCSTDALEEEPSGMQPTSKFSEFASFSNDKFREYHEKTPSVIAGFKASGRSLAQVLDFCASNVSSTIDSVYNSQAMVGLNRIFACLIAKEIVGDQITAKALFLGAVKNADITHWRNRQDVIPMLSDLLKASVLIIRSSIGDQPDGHNFSCNNIYDWLNCARWLVVHEHLRTPPGTDVPEGWVSDTIWRKNLDKACTTLDKLPSYDPALRSIVSDLSRRISVMLVAARCAQYGERPLPFNIALLSKPGTGKSTWIADAFICKALFGLDINLVAEELDDFKPYIVTVNQCDKFLSAYKPERHVAVVLDEMGAAKSDKDQDNQIMTNITNILGEGNWYINRAGVDDKGKDLYRPHVNVCISNVELFGIKNYLAAEAVDAFTRRIHCCIEVRVKDGFGKTQTDSQGQTISQPGIDLEKLYAETDRTCAVEFRIMVSNSGGRGFTPLDQKWISYREVSDYILEQAIIHRSRKGGLIDTRAYVDSIKFEACPHGFFKADKCKECNPPNIWTELESTSDDSTAVTVPYNFTRFVFDASDTLWIMIYSFLAVVFSPFKAISWVDAKLDHYHASRMVIQQDIYTATNLVDRLDSVVSRYAKYREEMIVRGSQGLYVLIAVVSGVIALKVYQSANSSPPKEEEEEDTFPYFTDKLPDIVFPTDSTDQPKLYQATAITEELIGSKPSGKLEGNRWDRDEGFIEPGVKSQSPSDIVERRVRRNLIVAEFRINGTNKVMRTHLFGVRDQYAVGVWHTLRHFAEGKASCSVIRFNETSLGMSVTDEHVMHGSHKLCTRISRDLGIIKLVDLNCFVDVTDHFPVKAQYSGSASTVTGYNLYRTRDSPHSMTKVNFRGAFNVVSYPDKHITGETYKCPVFQGYFNDTHSGHCGTPLVSKVGNLHHINGIAVASNLTAHIVAYHIVDQESIERGIAQVARKHSVLSPTSAVDFIGSKVLEAKLDEVQPLTSHDHAYYIPPEERGSIRCHGSLSTARTSKMKSSVVDMPLKEPLFKTFPKEYFHNLITPVFDGTLKDGKWVSPERNALRDYARQVTGINIEHLDAAVNDLVVKLCEIEDFQHDEIWDLETCINGQPDTEANPMPKKTSAGFGEGGKKYHHLEYSDPDHPDHPHYMKLNPEAQEKFNTMLEMASKGERFGIIFQTCPKDEPRAAEKVDERKIRIFTIGPLCFYLLCKKFFGGWMSIFTKNFLKSETVGGVNPFDSAWGRIFKILSEHPNIINGDFSKFDKKSSVLLIMAAFTVIIKVKQFFLAKKGKRMSTEYYNSCIMIASEIANPLILMDRCLIQLPGSLSSGVLLTFIINNIVNSLYIRLAYFHTLSDIMRGDIETAKLRESFKENVNFFGLGDDNTYSVSDYCKSFFNFRSIQKYFKSIGLNYTAADKSDNVYGTLPLEFATIGKRKWTWNEEYEIWTCPIEKPSIMKTLTVGLSSKTLTVQQHEDSCISSALPEFAQHGREEYNARVSDLKNLRPMYNYPTYEYFMLKQKANEVTPWVKEETTTIFDVDFLPLN